MAVHAAYLTERKSWSPTSKWWAATIVAVGGFLTTFASQGWEWSPAFAGAFITIATQRVVAYLVPNESPDAAPAGEPEPAPTG
jgi:hypothetical protein